MGEQSSNNILYTQTKAKVVLDKAMDHCRNAYENYHDNLLNSGYSDIAAAEACAHYYLDGKPYTKGLTLLGRSTALWSCCFWQDISAAGYAVDAVVLALGRSIRYGISEIYVLDRIIQGAPDALKRGIRYSQLFLRPQSPLWLSILNKSSTTSEDFKEFLRACGRLSEILKTHDETVENLQSQLNGERSKFCVKVHSFPLCTHLSGSRCQVREWAPQMSSSEELVFASADKWGSAFH